MINHRDVQAPINMTRTHEHECRRADTEDT